MSAEERVAIVNEDNEVVRVVSRQEMRRQHLPHRASYIALINPEGRFTVEVRTLGKDYAPGLLDACVGGVMQDGEDPHASARRELKEELGVDPGCTDFTFLGTYKIPAWGSSFVIGYLYLAKSDSLTRRQAEEVSGIMQLSSAELLAIPEDNYAYDSLLAFRELLTRAVREGVLDPALAAV